MSTNHENTPIKHTPGPWGFYTKPQPNGCPIVGARGLMVAIVAHSINAPDQKETALANAALIAAAPELLEEYRTLIQRLKSASESCMRGHSQLAEEICHEFADFNSPAIAKAEGK